MKILSVSVVVHDHESIKSDSGGAVTQASMSSSDSRLTALEWGLKGTGTVLAVFQLS
jgi:hypothetical protein